MKKFSASDKIPNSRLKRKGRLATLPEPSFSSGSILPGDDGRRGNIDDLTKSLRNKRVARLLRHHGDGESVFSSEPLISFTHDAKLGRRETVVVTIKTTLQVHKNDRQEEQMRRPAAEVFGREAARHYVPGIVAAFSLNHDRFSWDLRESDWSFSAVEPYSVDVWGDLLALSGGNYVWLVNLKTGEKRSCLHPWLCQVHTAKFSEDGSRLLVASAGFDAIFEFDTHSTKVVWEWFAWEHGFEQSPLGHFVVRSEERGKALAALGHKVLLVDDPGKFAYGIPTRHCPAHLNSACYDHDGNILVTLFHQGAGIVIDKRSGVARTVIGDLVNPHKLLRRKNGGYLVSDTRRGKLQFLDAENHRFREISLTNLPGLERSPQLSEFLQNTTELKPDLFASVDIHRNTLWLIDTKRRKYRGIKFPIEWSMHDVTSVGSEYQSRISALVGSTFGKVEATAASEKVIRHFAPDGSEVASMSLDHSGHHRGLDFEM